MNKFVFPVSNGVVVHNDEKKVVSLIKCDGQKKLKSMRTKNKIIFFHFPFARGLQVFFCGLFAMFSAHLLSRVICDEKQNKKVKNDKNKTISVVIAIIVSIISAILAAGVIGFLPSKLALYFLGYDVIPILRNLVILGFKFLFMTLFLLSVRLFPAIVEGFRFNCAFDMATNACVNVKNKKLVVEPCNFLNFLVFVVFFDVLVITLVGASFGFFFNLLFHLAVFIASVSFGYEFLLILSKSPFKILAIVTAYLVYAKPSLTHLETANVALTEMNLLCSQKGREFMEDESKKAFSVVYLEVRNKLQQAGIHEKSDADWLVATVLGKNRAEVKLVSTVTDKQYHDIMKAVERRCKGESLDNIFGYTEFYGLRFDVNKKVLTPRMETEILVELVIKSAKQIKNPKILDLGTGSGAIAVSVAKNCADAIVTAVDVSKSALATAQGNAKKNDVNVEFLHSNLFDGLKRKKKFDIIVSNPPYIKTQDIDKLDKNVKECDPHLALDGGEDGLDFYRQIVEKAPARLNSKGLIFFEIGKCQAVAVRKLLREGGFEEIKTIKDYNKIERVICGKLR